MALSNVDLSNAALRERAFENVHDVPTGGQYRNTEVHEWCTPCKRVLKSFIALRDEARAEQREADASEIRALVEALNTTHPHPVKLDWCNWCSSFWDFQRAATVRSQSPSLKGARNE